MNKLSKQPNSVLTISEVLPNTTTKDINLYNAHVTAKRLKSYETKEDLLFLNSVVVRWSQYVGVDTPEASTINMLANFIKENFPSLNGYDLKECVTLLATQSLPTEAKHYGKISPIYISEVLKAYQEYKSNIIFKVKDSIDKKEREIVVPMPDEERVINFKLLITLAKEDNTKGLFYMDAGDSLYNFIKFNKLIKLTPELIKEAMTAGEKDYQNAKKKKVVEATIKNQSYLSIADMQYEKDDIIKKGARQFVVNRFLLNLDLEPLLEKININMLRY
jgi:hypothetical protein